jgi:hypothetical protein
MHLRSAAFSRASVGGDVWREGSGSSLPPRRSPRRRRCRPRTGRSRSISAHRSTSTHRSARRPRPLRPGEVVGLVRLGGGAGGRRSWNYSPGRPPRDLQLRAPVTIGRPTAWSSLTKWFADEASERLWARRSWYRRVRRSPILRWGAETPSRGCGLGRPGGSVAAEVPSPIRPPARRSCSSLHPDRPAWGRSRGQRLSRSACRPSFVQLPSSYRERRCWSRRFGIWRCGSECRARPRQGPHRYRPAPHAGARQTDRRRAPAALRRARENPVPGRPSGRGTPGMIPRAGGAGATPLVPRRTARSPFGAASGGQTCSKDNSEAPLLCGAASRTARGRAEGGASAGPRVCLALAPWA